MHHIEFDSERDMNEFIFGHLATPQQRFEYVRNNRRGVRHQHKLTPIAPRPGSRPTVSVTIALPQPIERVACVIFEPDEVAIPLVQIDTEWDALNWQYLQTWSAELPAQAADTLVRYQVQVYTVGSAEPFVADEGEIFSYYVSDHGAPEWTAEAIIYQIFPDRFHPGSGRDWHPAERLDEIFGGTLRGIIENLDYIAGLGFNCIWLNPFFPDKSHHGYHATDYFSVNPRLGTEADLRELLDLAHGKGMRLILDFVANHWGSGHETFQQALQDKNSPYYDWYHWIEWPHDYHTFFGVMELPKVNVANQGVRNHLFEAARYWADFGFDGYRLDYALGPSHDFWTEFYAAVKRHKPEAWLFGEAVSTPTIISSYQGRFDGCLDFILLQALRDTFAFGSMNVGQFDAFLRQHEQFFPEEFGLLGFLDNHDMNRFLWLTQGDVRKLKLAALCQFTLKGAPVVYYGTEVGLSQLRDAVYPDGRHVMEESRLPMLWGEEQNTELREYYRWLVHFRRKHAVLWQGARETVHVDAAAQTYAYVRTNEAETILVAFNLSEEPRTFTAAGRKVALEGMTGSVVILD